MAENVSRSGKNPIDLSNAGWGLELVEYAANLFAICHDDCIGYVNPAGRKLLKVSSLEDVLGVSITDFVHPDYKDFFSFGLDVLAEEEGFVPVKLVAFDGDELDAKLLINKLVVQGQEYFTIEAQDITQYKRASEAVRDREHRLTSILNTVTEGILTFSEEGIVQSFNPAAEKIFDIPGQEVIGQHFAILLPEKNRDASQRFFVRHMMAAASRVLGKPIEIEGLNRKTGAFPMETSVNRLQLGSERLYTVVLRDITERKRSEAEIKHLAHHDALTGLPNRHLFEDRLDHALRMSSRYKKKLVLMFVDLDKFKPINDRLGHEAGDVVLKEVAARFTALVRSSDTVARIGGDEFVILLEELETVEPGEKIAQKVLACLEKPISVAGEDCYVGASIGLSRFPNDAEDADTLMRYADEAMYAVKAEGRNNYKVYDSSLSVLGGSA